MNIASARCNFGPQRVGGRHSRPEGAICCGRCETIERPDIDPVFRSQLTLPEVHEDSSREPREFGDRPQSRELRCPRFRAEGHVQGRRSLCLVSVY